jgi:hypothetical protein
MIQLTSADKLQKAISKARTVKPLVRINAFGSYTVVNKQTGATYTVECSKRDGRRFAACSCKAGELAITSRRRPLLTSSLPLNAPRSPTNAKG